MFDRIRQVFSKPKSPLSEQSREFVTALAAGDAWILAVGLRGIPEIPNVNDPEALAIIAAYRIDVSELGDDDSLFPFNYQREGRQTLPFFSSAERAREFATATGLSTDVTVFQPYCLRAGFVSAPENEGLELVLDARSAAERTLTHEEKLLLRSLTTASAR
jgi:hypothetical protein